MREVATVTSPGLNFHTAAYASAPIIDQLTTGDQITIDGHDGDWVHGKVTKTRSGKGIGQVGWVNSKFTSVNAVWDDPKPYVQGEPSSSSHYGIIALLVAVTAAAIAWFLGYGQ